MDRDELISKLKKLPYGTKILIGELPINGQIEAREIASIGTAITINDDDIETYYGMIYLTPKAE